MAEVEVGRAERELRRAGCDERRRAMRGEEAREEARGPTVERRRARDLGLGEGVSVGSLGRRGGRSGVSVWISMDVLSVKCSGGDARAGGWDGHKNSERVWVRGLVGNPKMTDTR